MKNKECVIGGLLKFTVPVPETSAEFNTLAKRTDGSDACCDEAVDNCLYRGTYADARGLLVERVEARTGKARLMKDNPDGRKYKEDVKEDGKVIAKAGDIVQVYAEGELEYLKRVAAEEGKDVSIFQGDLDKLMLEKDEAGNPLVSFDPAQKERKAPTPAGPTKQDKDTAAVIQKMEDAKFQSTIAKLQQLIGGDPIDQAKFRTDAAYAAGLTRAYRLEFNKQAANSLTA
jgi:hypothetical protein